MSPKGGNRRSHYLRLKALIKHMRDDAKEITTDMYDVFNDLLIRENWELIGAYELYIVTDDRDDLIDTLFVIYKTYSGSNEIEERYDEEVKSKQSMEDILFLFRTRFD